jgi:hypothetical protein
MTPRKSDRPDYPGELAAQCEFIGLRPAVREHRFHPVRKWRFDLAWPELLLAIEVDGGVWIEGWNAAMQGDVGNPYAWDDQPANREWNDGWWSAMAD